MFDNKRRCKSFFAGSKVVGQLEERRKVQFLAFLYDERE
jgi:hypothetical protein